MQRNNCNASFSVREWPLIKLRNHPIETGEYLVASDAVVRTCDTVTKWIEIGCPVGVIHGRPRLGKTRAIQYIINEFAGNGSAWPVSMIICKKYQTPSEASFYEDMLSDIGHGIIGGHVKNKHNRLCRLLLEKSELSGTNHFVLIIDEAQRLEQIQYNCLMDVYNELDSHGASLTVILVGQNELLNQRSVFITLEKVQKIEKFMVPTFQFEGIKKVEELETCLSGYDEYSEYPDKSGWSFTHYYFPDAFDSGFRLKSYSNEIFEIFKELHQENGVKKSLEIPIQYVTLTIEYFLKIFGVKGSNLKTFDKRHLKESIENSGYIEADIYRNIV